MYLKAIELYGFKSFPDKTRITFDKGMTAVIGPNGSGKSNISDAVRWVLGETSGKELRATGKMEDIIFGGASGRGPMGFASVSLILDNSDRSFDMDSDEISVTRKYYRGGEGEYFINSNRVRLRDIYELFLDTGLGKSGYSIVGQGKISQIVTAKPENRREIFEEASGIAKYRYKRNEAEKKLSGAQENIVRLSDILSGLEERVEPLRIESEKAKEFIALSDKKKGMEISLWLSTVENSKNLIRDEERSREIYQTEFDSLENDISQKESYIEQRYLYSNTLIQKSQENQELIRSKEQEISDKNADIAVMKNSDEYANQRLNQLKSELEEFDKQTDASKQIQEKLSAEINNLKQDKVNLEKKAEDIQNSITEKANSIKDTDAQKGLMLESQAQLEENIQEAKISLNSINTQNQSVNESVLKAENDKKTYSEYFETVETQVKDLEEFIRQCDDNIAKNNNIKNGINIKLNAQREKYQKAQDLINENQQKQRDTAGRIKLLSDMENSLDGFAQSVKTVLNTAKNGGLGGILGTVAQLIQVEKGYETAVEIALGYSLQNIIVEDETSAKHAMEYLKVNRAGRATFLPLDTVKPSSFNEKLPDFACVASSVVKTDDKYSHIISSLLGRTIITDDINFASRLAKQLNYRYKIVTKDGQQINAGGSFTGGSVSKSAGLFTRKGEIEKLKITLEQLKNQAAQLEKDAEKIKENGQQLKSSMEGCDGEIISLQEDKNNCNVELAKLVQQRSQYSENIKVCTQIIQNGREVLENNSRKYADLTAQLEKNTAALSSLKEKMDNMGESSRQTGEEITRLTDALQQIKLQSVQLEGEIAVKENNLAQQTALCENSKERKTKLLQEISDTRLEIENRIQTSQKLLQDIENLKKEIEIIENSNKDFVKERMEIEKERNTISQQVKQLNEQKISLSNKIIKISEKIAGLETAYDEIIQKLWEEYELTVQGAKEFCIEFEDENQLKRELYSVKNAIKRLGSVNVGAVEEYKEVFEKYTFLKQQLEDLNQSKLQLTKLIASLNGEMKTLFESSFNIINTNFLRIFKELFGGGSARLILTDPDNILESGVDIQVSPPGKVIKSLTALSGGEQALVAIAIYFAILDHNPSPFCVLDEIEAALDDANVARYANYLHNISEYTQFIVITHRRGTMEAADVLYGVTMQEDGISKLLKLDVNNISPSLIN